METERVILVWAPKPDITTYELAICLRYAAGSWDRSANFPAHPSNEPRVPSTFQRALQQRR